MTLTKEGLTSLVIALKDVHRELKLIRLIEEAKLPTTKLKQYESKVKQDQFLNVYRQGEDQ